MITLLFLYTFLQFATAFPENIPPITILQDVPQSVFIGNDGGNPLYVQVLKTLDIGGITYIVIAAREKVYLLDSQDLSSFSDNKLIKSFEILTWKSDNETRELCLMKGQPQEFCHNYLSILETKTDDSLVLCGTNSYSPQCANFEVSANEGEIKLLQDGATMPGRQISPFGPSQSGASLFTGDALYTATYQSLLGGTPVISRTMGNTPSLRTDTASTLMKAPEFVKITEDNDRVLIFFNEEDNLPTGEKRIIAQVAQICKNDKGGDRVLRRMFTSFLKSRLNCSYNGFYLDQVRDVTDPIQIEGQSVIFAAFATPDNSLSGSAICSFNLSSVHSSLSGPFLINNDANEFISTTVPPTGNRHPGRCPEEKATDSELVFIKSHTQMEKHVIGSLLLTNQGKRWTAVTVDVIPSRNNLSVLFIGTEDGHLVRALPPSRGHPRGKILSDQNVFDSAKCSAPKILEYPFPKQDRRIERILIKGDAVLVGFKHCVISLPLRWCSPHLCRSSCLRSSDPYCAWNGSVCVPVTTPDATLEQDLNSDSAAFSTPCLLTPKEQDQTLAVTEEKIDPTLANDSGEYTPDIKDEGSYLKLGSSYPLTLIVIVAVVATLGTAALTTTLYCCWYHHCRRKRKQHDPESFNSKQMQEHLKVIQADEKQNSLSRKAHKTFCGMKYWFLKTTTPVHSPEVPPKHDVMNRPQRRGNEYVPAPTVANPKSADKPRMNRIMSSRLNSTSSITSREDSLGISYSAQPLLQKHSRTSIPEADLTLPKHFAELDTLPLPAKPSGDSTTSSGVSSQSSGSSPVFPENGNGAAETGILQSASAKLRRRTENAEKKASEIMRDPNAAMGSFKDAFHNIKTMQVQGDVMLSDNERMQSPSRFRIDSHDSGRGESCRNSIRTEFDQVFQNNLRLQRPVSLDINKNTPGRRKRLHSEGSQPYDPNFGVMVVPQDPFTRERRISGSILSNSQASTPISEYPNGFLCQQMKQPITNVPISTYSTLTKDESIPKPQSRDITRIKASHQSELIPRQPVDGYFAKSDVSGHAPVYYKEPVYIPSYSTQYSCPNGSPNYYPSLQVRGAYAQKPLTMYPQKPQQKRRSYSPPQNYYPSLPIHNKSSQLNNRYSHPPPSYSSLDRQPTPAKKRQSAPLTRHTSMPASERPVGFASPQKPQKIAAVE